MPLQEVFTRRTLLASAGAAAATVILPPAGVTAATVADLESEFAAQGVAGTFVRLELATDRVTLVNAARAQKRIVPASTFKIINSLIAIETGAVTGPAETFAWDGKPAPMKEWERDMTLAEAITVSNVPVFQQIARRVGLARYEEWLDKLGYGNANPGTVVDRFWLDGPLTISAIEQTSMLAALALEELPMSKDTQKAVKDMLLLQTREGRRLYGKTGWLRATQPEVGWWVGWVEGAGRIDTFALNIDLQSQSDLPKRQAIGKAILARLGLFNR